MTPPTTIAEGTGDRELLARAAAGDRAAFGQLYDRHVRPVYWQAYSVVRDAGEAEDVTQDVFITTWDKIRHISVVDESVLPWLLVTARFTALNARRRSQKVRARSIELNADLADDSSVEDEVVAGQIRSEIDKAVAALSAHRPAPLRHVRRGRSHVRAGGARARRQPRRRPQPHLAPPHPAPRRPPFDEGDIMNTPTLNDDRVAAMRSSVMHAVDKDIAVRGHRARSTIGLAAASVLVVGFGSVGISALNGMNTGGGDGAQRQRRTAAARPSETVRAWTKAATSSAGGTGDTDQKAVTPEADREVITTGQINVSVKDPRAVAQKISAYAESIGGRVDTRTENGDGDDASAFVTVRVPSTKVTATIDKLKTYGTVEDVTLQNEDVTAQAKDLDARIDALRLSIDRLEKIMANSDTSAELIKAETALTQRQEQLESLEAQRKQIDDQVSLSTLSIDLSQKSTARLGRARRVQGRAHRRLERPGVDGQQRRRGRRHAAAVGRDRARALRRSTGSCRAAAARANCKRRSSAVRRRRLSIRTDVRHESRCFAIVLVRCADLERNGSGENPSVGSKV